jgi:hypothetical protein
MVFLMYPNLTVWNVIPEARSAIRDPAQVQVLSFRLDPGSGLPAGRQARGDMKYFHEERSKVYISWTSLLVVVAYF